MVLPLSVQFVLPAFVSLGAGAGGGADAREQAAWTERVAPLLEARCAKCHGDRKQKSGLRVDTLAHLIEGGDRGPALVPGDPDASWLVRAVRYDDEDLAMPPKGRLPSGEIELLTEWVRALDDSAGARGSEPGADVEPELRPVAEVEPFDLEARLAHWSFQPMADSEPPAVERERWVRDPLDAFVLARLEEDGLQPAPVADRRALARRLSFDLVGLPPDPDAVEAFEADRAPDAVERFVDALLESPGHGERWARHWLDLVRYAEARGHEFDFTIPNAWQYRDYVVRAFRADVPYDEFLREHVAGDLIAPPRLDPDTGAEESVLGTGFWYLGEEVHSPVDVRGDQADRLANQVDVFSKAFLGLTVACARCHDHKFDPILQEDYTALAGFPLSASYRQVRFDTRRHNAAVAERLAAFDRVNGGSLAFVVGRELEEAFEQEDLESVLVAAAEAWAAGPLWSTAEIPAEIDLLFEDFERPRFTWRVEGDAFGDRPILASEFHAPLHPRGRGAAHSHTAWRAGELSRDDGRKGRLVSPVFTVERDFVHLLVGGGAGAEEGNAVGVALEVDGEIVAVVRGRDANRLHPARFDARDLRGREARLVAFDEREGSFGHVSLDHVVFSDRAEATALELTRPPLLEAGWYRSALHAAEAHGVDVARVWPWLRELLRGAPEEASPLESLVCSTPEELSARERALREREARAVEILDGAQVVLDFARSGPFDGFGRDSWRTDGPVFGTGPVAAGDVRLGPDHTRPLLRVFERPAAEADPTWDVLSLADGVEREPGAVAWVQAGRTLRTETFVLERPRLYALVRGAGAIFAEVDGHRLVTGPLHGSTVRRFGASEDGGWQYVRLDLADYVGHRVRVELSPDPADGEPSDFGVCLVFASDAKEPPPATGRRGPGLEAAAAHVDRADRARAIASLFRRAAASLRTISLGVGPDGAEDARLLAWLARRPRLLPALDPVLDALLEAHHARRDAIAREIRPSSRLAPAMIEGNGVDELFLARGSHRAPRHAVRRRWLACLEGGASGGDGAEGAPLAGPESSGRLALARRLTDPESPLVARVWVNRVWHHLFGRGLLASVDDFGHMGDEPSHPELLDRLARDFVESGWSTRALLRRIVLSATYAQGSAASARAQERDPNNALLHHVPRRRLEGEALRDAILAASGGLDATSFGPPVPIHLTAFLQGRGRPSSGPVDGDGRRSIYLAVRRNFPQPFFQVFDAPTPATTAGRRSRSNVPAQALTLLNDPFVHGEARRFAESLLAEHDGLEARIEAAFQRALARPPRPEELEEVRGFLVEQAEDHGIDAEAFPDDPRPWADFCHVLFNLKEFAFIG